MESYTRTLARRPRGPYLSIPLHRYGINLIQLRNLSPFHQSVLNYWQNYRSSDFSDDIAEIQNEIIWNKSSILINKNTIFFKQWYQNGVIRLQDLLDVDGTSLSLQEFLQKLRVHIPFATYYGLINCIPAGWRRKRKSTDSPNHNQISSSDSSNVNITTPSAYAAILDHFFQPPTSETKILGYCFTKESLTLFICCKCFSSKSYTTYSQQDVPCFEQGCPTLRDVGYVGLNLNAFHTFSSNVTCSLCILDRFRTMVV